MTDKIKDIDAIRYGSYESPYCTLHGHNLTIEKLEGRLYQTCNQCGAIKALEHVVPKKEEE